MCAYCPNQRGNTCTCPTGQTFVAELGGCVCDWQQGFVTEFTSANSFTCVKCPSVFPGTTTCSCPSRGFFLSANYQVCSRCNADPNKHNDASGGCSCKAGFVWSEAEYPFRCVASYAGTFLSNAATATYPACSTLAANLRTPCSICDPASGFVLLASNNTCLYCSSLDSSTATGNAFTGGCECKDGFDWDPLLLICKT